jgi:hypothetical protein
MTQAQHPEELLAEYLDGTLEPDDRARVESHMAGCVSCREAVSLAGSARHALGMLPELDVPAGTTWPVVQRAGQRRRWLPALPPRVAWAAAGVAAVAAAVIGAFILVGGPRQFGGQDAGAPAEDAERLQAERGLADGEPAAQGTITSYPTFHRSDEDYDGTSLASLARDLTTEARTHLEEGSFIEPPARFYARATNLATADRTRQALSCVAEAVSPNRSLAPFVIVAARFEGEPAYIGAFLQADRPDQPYRQLALYVVSQDGCALRSFARQQL